MKTQEVSLSEACSLLTDGTHYTPQNVGIGKPFLTVKDVSDQGLNFLSCSRITEEDFALAKLGNSAPKRGDVLFSKDGTVGKVHVVETDEEFAVLSSLAILRPSDRTDSRYLAHALLSPRILQQALKKKTGSAIRRIILSDLGQIRIPLPSITEQKRIAAILDWAEKLRAKRRAAITLLDQLPQAIFLEMFGDPASNSKGWEVSPLGSAFHPERGTRCGPFGSALHRADYVTEGIPVWGIENVDTLQFNEAGSLFVDERQFRRLTAYDVKTGDILITRAGTVGKMCVARPTATQSMIGTNLIRMSLNLDVADPDFVVTLLTHFGRGLGSLRANAKEEAYSFMKTGVLKTLLVPLPPIKLQRKFSECVRATQRSKAVHLAAFSELDSLFRSIQARSFSRESQGSTEKPDV